MAIKRLLKVSAAAAIALCLAGGAIAQGPPREERGGGGWGMWGPGWGMWGGGGPGGGGMWGHWRWGGRGPDGRLDRIDGRLAFMKAELKITDAQTAAWNQFADAIRTAGKNRNERMKAIFSGDQRSKPLPERLDAQEQFMSAYLDETKQIKVSLKNLYAVLSDDQKKEADEMVFPMVGMGGPMW